MPDKMTIEQRHNNMAAIKGKDTKPEILVRKFLWARGFRYRLNHPRLPGKPDIVLRADALNLLLVNIYVVSQQLIEY